MKVEVEIYLIGIYYAMDPLMGPLDQALITQKRRQYNLRSSQVTILSGILESGT